MFEKLFDLISKVLTITARVDRHDKDIEKLQHEIARLSDLNNAQALKIELLMRLFNDEREKTVLWVENQMLKFELRLPAAKEDKSDEK